MKHTFLLIVAIIISINATAQNADSLVSKVEHIDSLNAKIEKLQHDLEFLSCKYELNKIVDDLITSCNEMNIRSNAVLLNCYHSRYNSRLYEAYKENYYSQKDWYDSFKENIDKTITLVSLKIIASNFSDMEIDYIKSCADVIGNAKVRFEKALDYYNTVLEMYRDL